MKVECEVTEIKKENDRGVEQDAVCVQCGRCDHEVEVFGVGDKSIKRGLATLREECPESEENFYVDANDE